MEDKKFTSSYTLDYKTFKEFRKVYLATNKNNLIILSIALLALIILIILKKYDIVFAVGISCIILLIISIIINPTKKSYKQTTILNNGEALKQKLEINGDNIILTSQKGNTSNYNLKQIIEIIESNNLFILKLKYNVGIIINKHNLDSNKEELLKYLFAKCSNLKTKKVINYKKWQIIRNIILTFIVLVILLSFFLILINSNKMDNYIEVYKENDYSVKTISDNYNYKSIEITNNESDLDGTLTIYRFTQNEKAEEFFKELLDYEITSEEKDKYLIENSGNYQKYIIENYQYVILIKDGKYIYYGTADTDLEQKENLNEMLNLIDNN